MRWALFTHADNLEEIPQVNQNLLIDYPPFPYHFGLHKIFGSYYVDIPNNARVNIMNYSFFLRYVFMLLFWFFGVFIIVLGKDLEYFDKRLSYNNNNVTKFLVIINILPIVLSMFVAYQIIFMCILSPFILISFFYHKFFDKICLFFEVY